MSLFTKIGHKAAAAAASWKLRRRLDLIDRSDVLLAHRVVARRRLPSLRQWRLLGRVITAPERKIVNYGIGLISLGLALGIGSWLMTHAVFVPTDGGEYREGVIGSPRSPNPILVGGNDADQDIVRLVYDGLYRRDAEGRLSLNLASSMETSPDGKRFVFTLRNDVFFHDGKPLTSADVVFTIQSIQNAAWKSPLAANLIGVTASAPDEKTVVLETSNPTAYLSASLTFGILPKHVWENITPTSRSLYDFNFKPIGTGPFMFDRFTRDRQGEILTYTLKANPLSGAKLSKITFKFYDDYQTAFDKLNSNAIDGLSFVPSGSVAAVNSIPGITLRKPALSQYTAIFLNPKKDSALADLKVRQALAYAINRDKILENALSGFGTLRDQPIPEGAGGSTEKITRFAFDPAQSARLLDEAGYPVSEETGIRTKTETTKPKTKKEEAVTTKTELAITLATVDSEANIAAAELIKEAWSGLGIKTDIVAAPAADIQKSVIRPREYDALLFGEILAPDSDPYPFWHSSQSDSGLNLSNYSNRRVDELLEKARLAKTESERNGYLAEFQEIVTREVPAIFLYQPDYLYPQSDKIKGFSANAVATPAGRFANVTEWYRKYKLSFR